MTRRVQQLVTTLLCLLAAQFLLGMTANFYARIPSALPAVTGNIDTRLGLAARWALLHGPLEIKLHVAVGLAIGACAISAVVLAIRTRQRSLVVSTLLGLVMTSFAGLSGAAFLASRRDDTYSLLMSAGFLGSVYCYWSALYVSRRTSQRQAENPPPAPVNLRDSRQ